MKQVSQWGSKIFGSTVQNLVTIATLCPRFVQLCISSIIAVHPCVHMKQLNLNPVDVRTNLCWGFFTKICQYSPILVKIAPPLPHTHARAHTQTNTLQILLYEDM